MANTRPYPDLSTWRAAQGISQSDAAYRLGISQPFYSRLERGLYHLPGKRAKLVMKRTGVSLEVLVGAA